ncbi:MAG: hypothetical protein Q9211_007153 [Gyalolechia sp. 1 TL-2023]
MAKKLGGVAGVLGGLTSYREEPAPPEPLPQPLQAAPEPETPLAETVPTEPVQDRQSPAAEVREQQRAGQGGRAEEPARRPARQVAEKIGARRGRPPGPRVAEVVDKEKVTLRLSAELMALYRDWSWDERCVVDQGVGNLVREADAEGGEPLLELIEGHRDAWDVLHVVEGVIPELVGRPVALSDGQPVPQKSLVESELDLPGFAADDGLHSVATHDPPVTTP